MHKTLWLTLIFLLVLSACAAPAVPSQVIVPTATSTTLALAATYIPQPTTTPVPFFTLYSDKPIVPKGQPGTWDDRFTDPGAVIYHDGMFHMFRNGFRGFPAESEVGYVTSTDGYTWTKQGDDPIIETKDVPYAKIAMYASSVLWEDGCWVLFFYTWDSTSFPSSSVIGRITQCVAGPALTEWLPDPEPLLKPGAAGAWDEQQVLAPHVLKTDNGYVMYYSGADASGIQMIGMATSTDGVTWTKYNDPATTDKPYADSDPVFQPGEKGTWDGSWVHQPRVFQTADGWVMIYRGTSDRNGSMMKLGLATSQDGIHWERYAGNPIFKPSDIKGAQQFWFTNAVLKDDVIYLFVEGDISQTTQIYLATHEGEIKPFTHELPPTVISTPQTNSVIDLESPAIVILKSSDINTSNFLKVDDGLEISNRSDCLPKDCAFSVWKILQQEALASSSTSSLQLVISLRSFQTPADAKSSAVKGMQNGGQPGYRLLEVPGNILPERSWAYAHAGWFVVVTTTYGNMEIDISLSHSTGGIEISESEKVGVLLVNLAKLQIDKLILETNK